ncbi:MAG: hypothetical protein C4K48_10190 [Candidatus Thorarchaeota archaeon]|nr:MAG: hypothetical protein C4K48_10190 [Candidatus Thorarchaeota archaeon]
MSDNTEDIERIARIVYDAIFQNRPSVEINGEAYSVKRTSKSRVRFIEHEGLTYMEQNKLKSSTWGKEAQEGHQILWVMRGRQYLARIRDGKFLDLKKR